MADQTLPLNVSDEMKADDERQNCVGMESDEELCSSSSDSAEELYSSSTTDAYGCRANNPDICGNNGMDGVCAFVREDCICKKPSRAWKRQYNKLKDR